jgi:UPF0176 protein
MKYVILLFYNYVQIEDPIALMHTQRTLCEKLGLKGRAIIAHEGINATFEGTAEAIEMYSAELLKDPRFTDTHLKRSDGTAIGNAFPRLSIKVRKEIVSLGLPAHEDISPKEITGKHLSPDELHQWFASGKKFKIVDMRNTYEHAVGHFKDSILPPLKNFRDLPEALPTLESIKAETVLTVCTGGVRCEKASGYLVKSGFKDVYQLSGGIVSYMEKYETTQAGQSVQTSARPAGNFLGSLYVFDDRMTMAFAEKEQRLVVGKCALCGVSSETYVNCRYDACHLQFIACEKCQSANVGNVMRCPFGTH